MAVRADNGYLFDIILPALAAQNCRPDAGIMTSHDQLILDSIDIFAASRTWRQFAVISVPESGALDA
jgi:hypothetical protein